jgi:Cytochrome c554 and c-prime
MATKRILIVIGVLAGILTVALFAQFGSDNIALGEEPAKYAGSKKCKTCHADQHKAWLGMKHSKAWDVLTPEQIASGKDAKGQACVMCHTTGYGKPNGFVSAEKTPLLKNVGCESCHGPAKTHVKTMTMAMMNEEEEDVVDKKISKDVTGCRNCHNPHISYKKLYGK